MFSAGITSFRVLLLFALWMTIFFFVHGFHVISSEIDEALSINPSVNVFLLEGLTSIIKTG